MRDHLPTTFVAAAGRAFAVGPGVAVVLAAVVLGAPQSAAAQDEPAATVEMTAGLEYLPESVTIGAGEAVVWNNTSDVVHTVTADPGKAGDQAHVELPKGAETFDSGFIGAGDSYSHTFEVPGTYTYFCIPHEAAGMIGEIVVE